MQKHLTFAGSTSTVTIPHARLCETPERCLRARTCTVHAQCMGSDMGCVPGRRAVDVSTPLAASSLPNLTDAFVFYPARTCYGANVRVACRCFSVHAQTKPSVGMPVIVIMPSLHGPPGARMPGCRPETHLMWYEGGWVSGWAHQ